MIPEKKKSDSWREALKFINKCPVCGSIYNTKNARLFASQDKASLIHISCVKCAGNFIAMVVEVGHSLSSMGMVSDLNFSDAEKFCQLEPIVMDEMIDGIRQIKENNLIKNYPDAKSGFRHSVGKI
ncbi:MAG: hypothetical protein COU29_00880 [Candidatus Magasanikbacteria bacterium CG10_big_fil_rev_8_21_14_0_10_36_32]|uniref:Uncharacterized protein n=1 Tax=Candidatus Magasanikbacteria bacterium CG10_big_fil_rev_8_21_14_0_10_36_32 TaxID=1974646 RepID=A0A2M6W6A9_9BACT|nr:MAG: hypothetical protein COU29_00880 [Candidatus Magasanikbacteria bacterium CG10_big_fil_rev_8_21_14_0_10_36_32]